MLLLLLLLLPRGDRAAGRGGLRILRQAHACKLLRRCCGVVAAGVRWRHLLLLLRRRLILALPLLFLQLLLPLGCALLLLGGFLRLAALLPLLHMGAAWHTCSGRLQRGPCCMGVQAAARSVQTAAIGHARQHTTRSSNPHPPTLVAASSCSSSAITASAAAAACSSSTALLAAAPSAAAAAAAALASRRCRSLSAMRSRPSTYEGL